MCVPFSVLLRIDPSCEILIFVRQMYLRVLLSFSQRSLVFFNPPFTTRFPHKLGQRELRIPLEVLSSVLCTSGDFNDFSPCFIFFESILRFT